MRITQEIASTTLAKDSKDNATATATASADTNGGRYYITGVEASYSVSTTSGLLQLKDGATIVWEQYIHGGDTFPFSSPIEGTANTAFSAVLSASGTAGTIGKVNLRGYLL